MGAVIARRVPLPALVVAAAAGVLVAAPVASATALKAGTTYYAVGKRACKTAKKPGYATCFADIRVLVKKGTKGAKPFKAAGGATSNATIGPAGGLTPSDLATAYGLTTTGGSGQTVAIVIWNNDPNINADLGNFDSQYGLAACSIANGCLRVVNQNGATSPLPANDTAGTAVEETLDVETVHSVCQGCKLVVVEANSAANTNLITAENTAVNTIHANEVNNSWGEPESGTSSTMQSAFNHPGTVITASTADDGYNSYDCMFGMTCSTASQPSIPSSYNTVVSVGGTSLYLGQSAARQSETVWNDNGVKGYFANGYGAPLGAEGGGCSTLFSAQGWQTHVSNWSSTACGTKRLNADVSADADYLTGFDIYMSYNCGGACSPGWQTLGGTSLASPIIAATYGLAGGAQGINYPALTPYGHLTSAYDVTSGGNGYCDGQGAAQCGNPNTLGFGVIDCDYTASNTVSTGDRACDALAGYDGPTGVGTPKGLTMFQKTGPTATISGPKTIAHGTSGTWTATTTDPFPGGTVSSFTWKWGDGSANTVTTTGSAAHTYTAAGTYTITLTVKDNYGAIGTKTYSVSVS